MIGRACEVVLSCFDWSIRDECCCHATLALDHVIVSDGSSVLRERDNEVNLLSSVPWLCAVFPADGIRVCPRMLLYRVVPASIQRCNFLT